MDFGRVREEELNKVDFSLDAEPAFNKKRLKRQAGKEPQTVYWLC